MGFRTGLHPLGGGIKDPYKKETVLFESATPGTYNLNLAGDGVCLVYCIGAGAGGNYSSDRNSKISRGGGSGAGFIGELLLKKGGLPIVVGAAGSENVAGGASNVGNVIIANGGLCGSGDGGAGGVVNVNSAYLAKTPELQVNGNKGSRNFSTGVLPSAGGGASVWGGYGAGGSGPHGSGAAGYVKIVYKRLKP